MSKIKRMKGKKEGKNEGKKTEKSGKKRKLLVSALGAITGFVNGIFGGGGGMILVPALKDRLNYTVKKAHATAILLILPLSVISGITYLVNIEVQLKTILLVSLGSTSGGVLGALLLKKLPEKITSILFITAMLFASVKMVFL